jgi:hypothetical protein
LGSTCSNLNTFPSENLWPNIGDALTALETLRVQIGVTIRVLATYQTPDFANCAETPKAVQASAEQFRTITFQVGGSTVEKVLQLLGAAYSTRVSISTNGTLIYLSGIPRAKPDLAERLGQWHAVVASHSLDRAGCAHAREDVFEFAKLLAESAAQGLPIYVSRTTGREVYAVSVDTGGDQALARKVVQLIRAAAPESADKRTGADSLVLSNKGWRLDDACRASAIIPPT